MSRVLKLWRRSPLTRVSTSVANGSASPTAMHGPSEQDVSKFLPIAKLCGPAGSRGLRMLQSPSSVTPQIHIFRLDIGAAPAKHDLELAFIIEAIGLLRIDHRTVGTGHLSVHLPEAPDAGITDLSPRIAGIGFALHLLGHRRGMVGEIPAGAGDAGAVRPRRMHMD